MAEILLTTNIGTFIGSGYSQSSSDWCLDNAVRVTERLIKTAGDPKLKVAETVTRHVSVESIEPGSDQPGRLIIRRFGDGVSFAMYELNGGPLVEAYKRFVAASQRQGLRGSGARDLAPGTRIVPPMDTVVGDPAAAPRVVVDGAA